ncbi:cysteine protease [Lithospermum erythrorhizon]|uniref:Cysteine protease n=1 Tax=Lithospermum erythrorhizon TaxID=34254 RepID=A0AAV3PIA0_LITER
MCSGLFVFLAVPVSGSSDRLMSFYPKCDPSRSFIFGVEHQLQCPSGKVSYNTENCYCLPLHIPLLKAMNKSELEAFQKVKAESNAEGKELSVEEIVSLRVLLKDCLDLFLSPQEVHDYYSSALNAKTTVIKKAGRMSFPDYLVLDMFEFIMGDGFQDEKLDVYIDVPDIIDTINPDAASSSVDQSQVDTLLTVGFNQRKVLKADGGDVEKPTDLIFGNVVPMDSSEKIGREGGSLIQKDFIVNFRFELRTLLHLNETDDFN